MTSHRFDRDYFEEGQRKQISGYTNYHWMPDRSFAEAVAIVQALTLVKGTPIIDYGCAKGYLTYALRKLGMDVWGEDISEYALENAHPNVKPYVSKPTDRRCTLLIAKDILEHVPESELPALLQSFSKRANFVFAAIPLGDDDMFRIREYEVDVTHVTKKPEDWWIDMFEDNGFELAGFTHKFGELKTKWTSQYPYGNGFFVLRSTKNED
jgi:SAM-dependent methyltransferase